jgi:DNA-binding response OmpR family regulator
MQAIVIASDADEKDFLGYVLRRSGLAVAASSDVRRIFTKWADHPADVVLVALDETDDLLEVLKLIRSETQTPCLMIVDAISERLHTQLLDQGADVLLTRPVSGSSLGAQVRALLRRSSGIPSFVLPALVTDGFNLDPSSRTITFENGEEQRLTQLEFRLLYILMTNRGQVVPTEVLIERVWGYTGEGNRELVRGLISRLRHKLEPDPNNPKLLETISGVGYRFTPSEELPSQPPLEG